MKILIAAGDSHTAGQDIDPNNINSCPQLSWPRWVADHYKMQWVNLAMGSSGNEQISRTVITCISTLIEMDKFPIEDITVAIAWSGFDRYEYLDSTLGLHRSLSLSSSMFSTFNSEIKKYVEVRSMIDPTGYPYYRNLYSVYLTAKFLESYNVKYYFMNALRQFVEPKDYVAEEKLVKEYTTLINLYGDKRIQNHLAFYDPEYSIKNYLKDIPNTQDGLHWGVDGQRKYADLIINHMEKVDANTWN